jgi:hypothetical protein
MCGLTLEGVRGPAAMDEREGGARMEFVVNQRPSLRRVMFISVSVLPVLSRKLMVPVLLRSP